MQNVHLHSPVVMFPTPYSWQWQTFCDFNEIIDISIKRICHEKGSHDSRMVTITRRDDRCLVFTHLTLPQSLFSVNWQFYLLFSNFTVNICCNTCQSINSWFALQEAKFQSPREALSFVSLVDGYFRLTTDSSHYFCQDVAPPSILEGIKNHCHGPITWVVVINTESNNTIHMHLLIDISFISCLIRSEFAVNKLKKSGFKGDTFLLRQSPKTYDNFFLTVCVQVSERFLLKQQNRQV